jgi:hypothetical protein
VSAADVAGHVFDAVGMSPPTCTSGGIFCGSTRIFGMPAQSTTLGRLALREEERLL